MVCLFDFFSQNWLIIVLVFAIISIMFILSMPKDEYQWILADGVRIQSISKEAKIVYVNNAFESRVKELKLKNKLIAFRGESIGGGVDTIRARDKAKMNAYKELAEYFNAKIQTFAQLVEGQLQSVSTSGKNQQIKDAAISAYKRVTEMFSEAQVSGTYIYAIWEEYAGSLVYTNVLLIFDPEGAIEAAKQKVLADKELSNQIEELGKSGVDFFKALNSIIEEAKK
ncbi:MAG: hypothetical protein N2Z58_08445 [Fervidobacterium sp.]|nr:hypothetical protein [Fervidobacterium sp.]